MKDILTLCPDLPIQKKPGYLELCEMYIFVLFDYAVSISYGTINLTYTMLQCYNVTMIQHNVMQERNRCKIFSNRNFYLPCQDSKAHLQ